MTMRFLNGDNKQSLDTTENEMKNKVDGSIIQPFRFQDEELLKLPNTKWCHFGGKTRHPSSFHHMGFGENVKRWKQTIRF